MTNLGVLFSREDLIGGQGREKDIFPVFSLSLSLSLSLFLFLSLLYTCRLVTLFEMAKLEHTRCVFIYIQEQNIIKSQI